MFPRIPSTFHFCWHHRNLGGFPDGLDGKESACSGRALGLDPWVGEDPLEKQMAAPSSILAWEIPRTEEPGGLQSMGHKQSDMTEWLSTCTHTHTHTHTY